MTATKSTITGALVALVFQLPGPPGGRSIEARCDEGQNVQDVINRAAIGTTITVFGICSENVAIPRSKTAVRVTGGSADAEIIGRVPTNPVVDVQATGVSIDNLTISGPAVAIPGEPRGVGISVLDGASARISHSLIRNNNASGVRVVAAGAVLMENEITANVLGQPVGSAGVELLYNSTVQLLDNHIEENNGTGLYARAQSQVVVLGGIIRNNRGDGVQLHQISHGEFSGAVVNENQGFGIRCFDSKLAGAGTAISLRSAMSLVMCSVHGFPHPGRQDRQALLARQDLP